MISLVFSAWFCGFIYLFKDVLLSIDASPQITEQGRVVLQHEKLAERQKLAGRLQAAIRHQQDMDGVESSVMLDAKAAEPTAKVVAQDDMQISTGWMSIVDIWGRQVIKYRAVASSGGWLALPNRACLGGEKWLFSRDYGGVAHVDGGLWDEDSTVGLWHISSKSAGGDEPALVAWNSERSVNWLSLESANQQQSVQFSEDARQGDFVTCSLPDNMAEIGVFVQDGHIVGWTFGQWLIKGYLWRGGAGGDLKTNHTVNDFYNQTFAGGREEGFAKSLAIMGGKDRNLERMMALVEGFYLPAKLVREDTPYYLLPEEIVKQLREMANLEIKAGNGLAVAKIFNVNVLQRIGDINLLMDVIPAVTAASGFEAAISLIEGVGRTIVQRGGRDVPILNTLHVQLYQHWLQSLVTVQAVNEGMPIWKTASAYYPDNPDIYLIGVELFLLDNNWQEAEHLLYSRDYPPALQDRFKVLASRTSEIKGQEGKIVVNFTPGASRIPVNVLLNGTINQAFMVDTGASMLTIPSDTAYALGLSVVAGSQTVSTAGGPVSAEQVIIATLEIDGWVEHDVKALILDIPDRVGVGLLGLNYLQRFKVDLNNASGTMVLSPK